MAQTVIIQLTDDLEGGEADETVSFSLDGKDYVIDLNKVNATTLRSAFKPYVDKARLDSRSGTPKPRPRPANTRSVTLFAQLNAEEKDHFRVWANMPKARRIGDTRVKEWVDAGKP